MKTITSVLALLIIAAPLCAQRTTDKEGGKDYPLVSRLDGSIIEYYKTTKWDEYHIPCNFDDGFLQWEAPAKLEGQIYRIQYSANAENNPNYVLKMLKSSIVKDGFKVILAQNSGEMGLSPAQFCGGFYGELKNNKFGFAYDPNGADQSLIIAKASDKDIYVVYYVSGFSNTTLVTLDVIEAETFDQKMIIATPYRGSSLSYDDKLGYGEFYVNIGKTLEGKAKITKVEGNIQNRFFRAPEGRSALEIVKNYEAAITKAGGQVLMIGESKESIDAFMKVNGHPVPNRNDYNYMVFNAYQYFCGIIHSEDVDYFVVVAAGKGEHDICYHLVTIETKPMDLGMVSDNNISESMLADGHMAFYDILFETGNAEVKPGSEATLAYIAEFLNANAEKKYYIVGHTDNTGDFNSNMTLSENRAKAVMDYLISNLGVSSEQIKAYGVSSLVPVASNDTPKGKTKNRRVEIVVQ